MARQFEYPQAPRSDVVDVLHGENVPDPFRPLEDPHADVTRKWIDEQIQVTRGYLDEIPVQQKLHKRIAALFVADRKFPPQDAGDWLYFQQQKGDQDQPVYCRSKPDGSDEQVILDCNALSEDGTVTITTSSACPNDKKFAYLQNAAGSDWGEILVKDLDSGATSADCLKFVKFTAISWLEDGTAFFYTRFPEPDEKTKHEDVSKDAALYLHRLGDPQSKDVRVFDHDDPEVGPLGLVSDDGRFLIVQCFKGAGHEFQVYMKPISDLAQPALPLVGEWRSTYLFAGQAGDQLFFNTTDGASSGQVVAFDATKPEAGSRVVIPAVDATLQGVQYVRGRFFAKYMRDARSEIVIYDGEGKKERVLDLPGLGAVQGFAVDRVKSKALYYSFESFTSPPTIYRFDLATSEVTEWFRRNNDFDPATFETRQIFYSSKDGTRVPMFVSGRRDVLEAAASAKTFPCLLYGYGGFNISIEPGYSVTRQVFMEEGGIYAVANIRGGGEYGDDWHKAGTKERKQNVFDDFIAAAEHLIAEGFTTSEQLAINGGSNGGLLVGACMTQRPELFRAAVPAVGVLDMLRFHKFTVGWAWTGDFGDPEKEDEYKYLRQYSPLHHIKKGTQYPATLITTADHDDRVVPAHSFKFAAALQEAHDGDRPVLIRIDKKAGHGLGKPTSKIVDEGADVLSFLWQELAMGDAK